MASNATAVMDIEAADSATALLVAKVTAMVVLGVVSMLVGLLPVKLAKWLRWSAATDGEVVKSTGVGMSPSGRLI